MELRAKVVKGGRLVLARGGKRSVASPDEESYPRWLLRATFVVFPRRPE